MNHLKSLTFVLGLRMLRGTSFRPPELHSSTGEMAKKLEIPKFYDNLFIYL